MGAVTTTLGYTHVHDYATMISDTAGSGGYIQQRNLATQQIVSLSLGSPIPIAKCCTGYVNVWYNYQFFDGMIGPNKFNLVIPSYGAYLMQGFNIWKNLSAEISGWYGGPSVWGGTWRTKSMGGMDIGIQNQFLDKKAVVKLTVTDIFFTSSWRSTNDFGGMLIHGTGGYESRTVRVSFTYRFGSTNISKAREHHSGLESESSRIKGK